MKKILYTIFFVFLIFTFFYYWRHPPNAKVVIRDHIFTVDVAVTTLEKERGLSYRRSMSEDHGMLFVYDHPEQYQFWMKGMKFPLDFIWIRGKTIVDISQHVLPPVGNEQPQVVVPKVSVDKILEINEGIVQKYGIHIGDSVTFQTN